MSLPARAAAKALMEEAGVPLVPGYHGEAQDLATFRAAATTSSTGAANSARDTGSISHPEMARNGFSWNCPSRTMVLTAGEDGAGFEEVSAMG